MLQTLRLSNKSLLISYECIFFQFFLFVCSTKTWCDRAALPIVSWRRMKVTMYVASVSSLWSSEPLFWFVTFRQEATFGIISLKCTSFRSKYILYGDFFIITHKIFISLPSSERKHFIPLGKNKPITWRYIKSPSWIPYLVYFSTWYKIFSLWLFVYHSAPLLSY